MTSEMTVDEEYEFYAKAENRELAGKPRRLNRGRLSEPIPVRFSPEQLEAIKERAGADDRSVSSWIRRAVDHELGRTG